jgi:hypothetical protein
MTGDVHELRREAASARHALRTVEAQLVDLRKGEDVKRWEAKRHDAEQAALATERRVMQLTAAHVAGLDPDLADRLIGDTDIELRTDAERLAKLT